MALEIYGRASADIYGVQKHLTGTHILHYGTSWSMMIAHFYIWSGGEVKFH